MKKGTFAELIGVNLIIVMLLAAPVCIAYSEPTAAMGAAMYTYFFGGPVITLLVGIMCGLVKRMPSVTIIVTVAVCVVTAVLVKASGWFVIIPVLTLCLGAIIGWGISRMKVRKK